MDANEQRDVMKFAYRIFGDVARADSWLKRPKERFGGRTPLEMLETSEGTELVVEMLGQIEHGMFA